MQLYARIQQKTRPPSTQRLSVARVLRAFGQAIDEYKSQPDPDQSLPRKLRNAVMDNYQRKNKTSRNYPRKKYETKAKPPLILIATPVQKQHAKHVLETPSPKP